MEGFDINHLITADKKTIEHGGGKTKNKGGRPKAKEPKNKKVMSNFTEKEYLRIKEEAENNGISLANFIRIIVLKNTRVKNDF